jgi:hypothetical protein
MDDKLIRYEVTDGVAVLTMDDPPANWTMRSSGRGSTRPST